MTFTLNEMMKWFEIPHTGAVSYFIKCCEKNDRFNFYVSNFEKIWHIRLSSNEFSNLIQKFNPLLVCDKDVSLIKYSLDLFFNGLSKKEIETSLSFMHSDSQICKFDVKVMKAQYPLKLQLDLNLSTSETLFEQVTIPLMKSLKDVQASENHLKELVKKKDLEISEYKAEGGLLSLKHLETKTFNEEEHRRLFKSNNIFHDSTYIASILGTAEESENSKEMTNPDHPCRFGSITAAVKPEYNVVPTLAVAFKEEVNESNITQESSLIKVKVEPSPTKMKKKAPKRPLNF